MKYTEASYYTTRDDGSVQCMLCPQGCLISEGKVGLCLGRKNEGGTLYAINYGKTVSIAVDPVEKKPLYHFHPGRTILSIAPNGCNLTCAHCQNWEISQTSVPTRDLPPEELVAMALDSGGVGVAYTYTEPLIWYEYLLDAGKLVHEAGLANVLVTNGYINAKPLGDLLPLIDAMNIDVKSMDDAFYRTQCRGRLEPVLRTARMAREKGCHLEITNLIIPSLNDSDEDLDRLIAWVADLGHDIPLHFSRYFPRYQCDLPATPAQTLQRAYQKARERLSYVYVGNISLPGAGDTHCPQCGALLVSRSGYDVRLHQIEGGHCQVCGGPVTIVDA